LKRKQGINTCKFPFFFKIGVFVLERRKIQKVGGSTLSVSLPKDWLKHTGVKVGDTVYLNYGGDGSLRIFSENLRRKQNTLSEYHINCNFTMDPNLLERLIVGSYMLGRDTIKIFSSTRISGEQIEEVRNIARRLVGLSILEESKKEILLQCTIEPTKFKIYSLVKRMSVIVSTMLSEALEALLQLNPDLAHDVIKREDEVNTVYRLITRLLLSAEDPHALADELGLYEPLASTDIRLISKSLERVADCSEGIAKIVLELQEYRDTVDRIELETISSIEQLTRDLFQKSVDSVLSRDLLTANYAINLRLKLDDELDARIRKVSIPHFRAIAVTLAMIAENSATMASAAINMEISKSDSFPPSQQRS